MTDVHKPFSPIRVLLIIGLSLLSTTGFAKSIKWQPVAKGLHYAHLAPKELSPFAQIHLFNINPRKLKLRFCEMPSGAANVESVAKANNALLAANGAFFSPGYQPLGLRVNNGRVLSPIKPISWWGVFYIKGHRARIVPYRKFRMRRSMAFAIQAGPRLVINNTIPKLKPGIADRTAIGIAPNGNIILLVSEHAQMTTTYLAGLFRDTLGCRNALNLDGGSSSQLYAHIGEFKRKVVGFNKVPTPICLLNYKK